MSGLSFHRISGPGASSYPEDGNHSEYILLHTFCSVFGNGPTDSKTAQVLASTSKTSKPAVFALDSELASEFVLELVPEFVLALVPSLIPVYAPSLEVATPM